MIKSNELIGQIQIEKLFTASYLEERIFLFESKSPIFYINRLSGEIRVLNDLTWDSFTQNSDSLTFKFALNEIELFKLTSRFEFNVKIHFKFEPSHAQDLKLILPSLVRQSYDIEMDKALLKADSSAAKSDLLMIKSYDFNYVSKQHETFINRMFNLTYVIRKNQPDLDLPFYVDANSGQLFFFNNQLNTLDSYNFRIAIVYKFNLNERVTFVQLVDVNVEILNNLKISNQQLIVEREENTGTLFERNVITTLDLEISVTSSDLLMYVKSPLIGFISPDSLLTERYNYQFDPPTFKLIVQTPPRLLSSSLSSSVQNMFQNTTLSTPKTSKKASNKNKKSGKKSNKKLSSQKKVSKRSDLFASYFNQRNIESTEQELLYENLFSMLSLDENTGALYFKSSLLNETITPLAFYSKIAKLIKLYNFERNLASKLVRLDIELINSVSNVTLTRWINLVFSQATPAVPNNSSITNMHIPVNGFHKNKFLINSNNLLNLFRNGDEFVISVNLAENSQSFVPGENRLVIDLNRYFRSKLAGTANEFIYLNLLKQLRFYLASEGEHSANDLFEIDNINGNNLLYIKQAIQLDYEVSQSHLVKLMLVQYLDANTTDQSTSTDHLVFNVKDTEQTPTFVYWVDLVINVMNELDEPFVCAQPVYTIEVDENEVKNKKLFTLELNDYEMVTDDEEITMDDDSRYRAQIVSGNAQGLFQMQGLSLHTGSSSRKLDRETRAQHELEIRIIDQLASNYSVRSAAASCKVIINVNDINDNRPIVNDVELSIYDRLDAKLIDEMRVPIANPIAVDQDQIAKLTYSIVSIKIVNGN